MANVTAVTLVKQMTYRGDATEEWSNKYYLTGTAPANPTAWKVLYDDIILNEKGCYTSASRVIRAYGYDQAETDTSPAAVDSHDYLAAGATVAGVLTGSGGILTAGDQAAVISWKTSRLNTKGKPIYLRKYFHSTLMDATTHDNLHAAVPTALNAFSNAMTSAGVGVGPSFMRSRLHAETFISHRVDPFVTTRTLKRRGRRP